jgi:hypothetical protein
MAIPQFVRRTAQVVSRHVYFDRSLPARFGNLKLRVSPAASLVYYRGLRVPNFNDLYDFAEFHVKKGDTVWDIGCNMGGIQFLGGLESRTRRARAGSGARHLVRRAAQAFMLVQ